MELSPAGRFVRNVLLKAAVLFVALNLVMVLAGTPRLGQISAYNRLFPGRLRFPFGENSQQAYNLSLYDLDAMFAAHVLAGGAKAVDEYRVLVVGDSSVWGTLLRPEETLAGRLDAAGLQCGGRRVRVYNLGYPTISLTKDLMIIELARRYQPDLIVWPLTLEALPQDKQTASPLVANNPQVVQALAQTYALKPPALPEPDWWQRTIFGQRRPLYDLFRLQMYGVMWAATGIDQDYPASYERAQTDLENNLDFHGWQPPDLPVERLAFDVLAAGQRAAGETPVLLVNEPMLVSAGKNSDLRYNFFYPRWAYDHYRQLLEQRSRQSGWRYVDYWNLVPAAEFTNSAIHLTPAGEALLAQRLSADIEEMFCR